MKLTDKIPVDSYTAHEIHADLIFFEGLEEYNSHADVKYYKVEDIEEFLTKLSKPENLNKIVKSLMFGGEIKLEELLK